MRFLWLVLVLTFAVACDSKRAPLPGQARTIRVQIGARPFVLEIADNPSSRQRGLMFRRSLPADGGMLFVFEQADVLRFWMRNTYIPLDILYLDKTGKVVAIRQMKPLDETSVSSEKPAKFAIELNAGSAAAVGAKEGDLIAMPGYVKNDE